MKIAEMAQEEMEALLGSVGFSHLGCSRDGHPYVVPMNYVYAGGALYFLTTEGTKTEYITSNPEVCFQVEEVSGPGHWRSVMAIGRAERLVAAEEIEQAISLISRRHPHMMPALAPTEIGSWHRPANIALYRIRRADLYGRQTA